jgi:hypothetical protein
LFRKPLGAIIDNYPLHLITHLIPKLRETGAMEHSEWEAAGRKVFQGRKKKPYTSPTLKVHGDVEEITKVLRLADARRTDNSPSIDNFL